MDVINWIIANWDFILLIAAALACVLFAIFKGNKGIVMKMLYALVTEAEKELGSGTGSLKLAQVIERIYPKLPTIIKTFISEKTLQRWVEKALAAAKEAWANNIKLAEYIETPAETAPAEPQGDETPKAE